MSDKAIEDRLSEWFLQMGFPTERLPPTKVFNEMCRGNYQKLWRNLMQCALPKQDVRYRRLAVFAEEMAKYEKIENTVQERLDTVILPDELKLWRETKRAKKAIEEVKARLANKKSELKTVLSSVKMKAIHRNTTELTMDSQRRTAYLLARKHVELSHELDQLQQMCCLVADFRLGPGTEALKGDEDRRRLVVQDSVESCLRSLTELSCKRLVADRSQTTLAQASGRAGPGRFNSTAMSGGLDVENVSAVSTESGNYEHDLQSFELAKQHTHKQLNARLSEMRGSELWNELVSRQQVAVKAMAEMAASAGNVSSNGSCTALSMIALGSGTHCTLALDTLRNRAQTSSVTRLIAHRVKQFANEQEENVLAGTQESEIESRIELFVLKCEEAELKAKKLAYQNELNDLVNRSGTYGRIQSKNGRNDATDCRRTDAVKSLDDIKFLKVEILDLDRLCILKKTQIENAILRLDQLGFKMVSVYRQLRVLMSAFQSEGLDLRGRIPPACRGENQSVLGSNYDDFMNYLVDCQGDFTLNTTSKVQVAAKTFKAQVESVREFYDGKQSQTLTVDPKQVLELSLDFEVDKSCESSVTSGMEVGGSQPGPVKFSDELKYFLKSFCLEKNRKLVLASGESLWIHQTLDRRILRLYNSLHRGHPEQRLKNKEMFVPNPCLEASWLVMEHAARICRENWMRRFLDNVESGLDSAGWKDEHYCDIESALEQDESRLDRMKRRLNENSLLLTRISNLLVNADENVKFWTGSDLGQFLSRSRTVEGLCYSEYQQIYKECVNDRLYAGF